MKNRVKLFGSEISVLLLLIFLCMVAITVTTTDGTETPKLILTEVQTLRLQVKQRDAQIAQRDLQAAQGKFQQTLVDLNNEAEQIKKDNKWPATVVFDPNTLSFSEPPKKAEEKKP